MCRRTGRRREVPRRAGRRDPRARRAGRRLRRLHVGQHRRPDHARAHEPSVRRAGADPVRHRGHGRPPQRVRPPVPGGSRRSVRRRAPCCAAWESATSCCATTSSTSATTSCRRVSSPASSPEIPGLGKPTGFGSKSPSSAGEAGARCARGRRDRPGRARERAAAQPGRGVSRRQPDADRAGRVGPAGR